MHFARVQIEVDVGQRADAGKRFREAGCAEQ
jgi:hypothetical protein